MMDIVSPASPMRLALTSDVHKAATVFLSHVRRTFQRHPSDYTGELVRLLDDIAVVTRTISSCVTEGSGTGGVSYGAVGGGLDSVDGIAATKHLYRALRNDGYCCIILSKDVEQPLTFPDDVPHGNYVVCVSPLDFDKGGPAEISIAGTVFSIYKRKSSTSLPGRGIDIKQSAADQVAAGYCCYSSATTLHYTMGQGLYSFVLHPVALQYFLQPSTRIAIPDATTVYCDRTLLLAKQSALGKVLQKCVESYQGSTITTGCLVGDLHMLLQTGGVLFARDVHLLCDAAPMAFVIEQAGGLALTVNGARILDLAVKEDHHATVTMVAGSLVTVEKLNLGESHISNGNGTRHENGFGDDDPFQD